MRIIILTADHLYANVVLKDLITIFKKDIKQVVISKVILHKHSLIVSLKKYFLISGIYYFLAQVFKLEIYKVLSSVVKNKKNKFYSFKHLLKNEKIPVVSAVDVNSRLFIRKIAKINPDLIISVFFNQILSPEIIKLSKKGAINIHPAYLPNYKGVSPVFWALANSEKFSGVSVHYINEDIDTGGIIYRKKIPISKNDGEDSLYLRTAREGVVLLTKAINDISKGRVKTVNNTRGTYFSLPTKAAVEKFKKKGRNFFRIREYIFK